LRLPGPCQRAAATEPHPGRIRAGKAPPPDGAHPFREKHLAAEKTKKPEPVFNRFGLYCPTPDWQHWQSVSNDW